MKVFTIRKVGYTAGVYGNSGEYYNVFMIRGNKYRYLNFSGQYGADDRIKEALRKRGFKELYNGGDYGRLNYRDAQKTFMSEYKIRDYIEGPKFLKSFNDIERQ